MKNARMTFDGFSTNSHGIFVTGKDTHNAPERDVTTFKIAGRNGDFFVDNGRWSNIKVTYPCFVAGFSAHEQEIRNHFGFPRTEYSVLEDTYDEDHYRLARPVGGVVFEPVRGDFANFDLVFDCDPRRFLFTGEGSTEIENGAASLTNPTQFEAKPLICIEGVTEGTEITVATSDGKLYTMTATDDFADVVEIDSERQDVVTYVMGVQENKNGLFDMPDGFPVLSGTSNITITGGYTYACITPRWWEL